MKRLTRILLLAMMSVLLWGMGNDISALYAANPQDSKELSHNDTLTDACDDSRQSYDDWNSLEITSAQGQIFCGRQPESSTRVRTSGGSHNRPTTLRSSFCKDGKIISLNSTYEFLSGRGLLPSGKQTFSQFLLSLRKLRL